MIQIAIACFLIQAILRFIEVKPNFFSETITNTLKFATYGGWIALTIQFRKMPIATLPESFHSEEWPAFLQKIVAFPGGHEGTVGFIFYMMMCKVVTKQLIK